MPTMPIVRATVGQPTAPAAPGLADARPTRQAQPTTRTYDLYLRLVPLPLGTRLFSVLYALKAPYFWTVRPQVRAMAPHHAEVVVPLRWAVRNHIGTLHAIAAVNGLEAAMGLVAEATCPEDKRWIPVGMSVQPRSADVHSWVIVSVFSGSVGGDCARGRGVAAGVPGSSTGVPCSCR
jgi:Domain of unknown function (DUF4442)